MLFRSGEIAAMSGLCGSMLGDIGEPYLMTAAAAERVPLTFVKHAKISIEEMLQHKLRLEGYVDASYTKACRLLEVLGFTLDAPEPFGKTKTAFRRYHLEKRDLDARAHQSCTLRPKATFAPFIIYTAGRSRTAWLSAFLTYGKAKCHTEIAIKFRSMEAVAGFFSPGIGSAETGVAPGWQLINHYVPSVRSVVVRRPFDEIISSFARIAPIDEAKLRKIIAYENRCLEKISLQPNVLTVDFKDLEKWQTCKKVFEHCLPYEFDYDWWDFMRNKNIQSSVADIFNYYQDHRKEVDGFKITCKREMISLVRSGKIKKQVG